MVMVIPTPWIPDLVRRISLATHSHFVVRTYCTCARCPWLSSLADPPDLSAVPVVVRDIINELTPGLNYRIDAMLFISEFQSWKGDFVAVPHWHDVVPVLTPVRAVWTRPTL